MPTQDDITTSRVGVVEELIKFRPSPNFKNMKKFLKNRSETERKTVSPVENVAPAPEPAPIPVNPVKKVEPKEDVKPLLTVQPPLPPYPPPPDSPPKLGIIIKKEKVDEDETPYTECTTETLNQEPNPAPAQGNSDKPKKTMCKEYIRGNCKRPVCRFAHEIDLAQLRGVFTFCWNYQNDVCNFPNCRYVHADIFEEAEFYRTGILPAHARSHQKKAPTPPLQAEESQPQQISNNFGNPLQQCPPPIVHTSNEKPPVITCIAASNISQQPAEDDFRAPLTQNTSPLKRDWKDVESVTSAPRDLEPEHFAKKCNNCEMMAFREQYNKEKVESMIQKTTDDFNKKMAILNKKSAKLANVLQTLMKPATIFEQLNLVINGNTRLSSVINDDNLKHMHASNINLADLVKLLRTTGEHTIAPDTRET